IILLMILLYTYEGGVKTIVWTDMLQTSCMLAGLVICIFFILSKLDLSLFQSLGVMSDKNYTQVFFTDPSSKFFFLKQVLAGAFITITMTGMDQEMMQKNISVRTLRDSKKNVLTLGVIMLIVISMFLLLGGLLHLYAEQLGATWTTNAEGAKRYMLEGADATADKLFPLLALEYMPPIVSVIFIIALISALFPSADGAITALTSSFCIDIMGMQRRTDWSDVQKKKYRQRVHLIFALIFLLFVMVFKWVNNPSMIGVILKVAGYTYGPLLGLFSFGILTKRVVADRLVPFVALLAPLISFLLDTYQGVLFSGFEIGLELLIINGVLTFVGLLLVSRPANAEVASA
ncbi:MAG: sodium:solute symporter family transporter, partial [Chitinophagaceae bacterium]